VRGVLLLLVAHTITEIALDGELIRIISAREASPQERRNYEDENRALYIG
jgi:uncharacterized DUF497 family protein